MNLLLDTHVLVWWKAGGRRLSERARSEMVRADSLLVSPMSFWEIGMLASRGRLSLDRDLHQWVADVVGDDDIELAPLSAPTAVSAAQFDATFSPDPADRLIYATARDALVPLVSKDARLREYARAHRDVRVIW